MRPFIQKSLLLIGAGSIGRAHLRAASQRYQRFVVVDPVASAREAISQFVSGDVACYESLGEAQDRLASDREEFTAIVSNWGPAHFETFNTLASAGVRRMLIEKPMAASAAMAHQMALTADELGIRLVVGNSRRYNGMVGFILSQFLNVGDEPVSIAVHGGALCTVTNGMHWLDLSCALFQGLPASVTADLEEGGINPRAEHLGYWDGTVTWAFTGGRRLTVAYSNLSSIAGQMSIYGQFSRLDIDDHNDVWFAQRDESSVKADPRVTRYGPVSEPVQKLNFSPATSSTVIMLDQLESQDEIRPQPSEHAAVVEALLASLHASAVGSRITLPLAPNDAAFSREWPVS